jgi:hypothetical protein
LVLNRFYPALLEDVDDPTIVNIRHIAPFLRQQFLFQSSSSQRNAAVELTLDLFRDYQGRDEFKDLFTDLFRIQTSSLPRNIQGIFSYSKQAWEEQRMAE